MARKLSPAYRPRRPTDTALYRVLHEHLADFIARVERADRPMPTFVRAELERFLTCGILEFGLAIQKCSSCSFNRVVGFSCGGRGFCPSCLGRRMAETSIHLVDSILPRVPYRQFVLSLPPPLRFLLAYDAEMCGLVLQLFLRGVFNWQRRTAKGELGLRNVNDMHCGAVTAIQRAGGAANLNLHYHSAVADGVYVREPQRNTLRFFALPAPTQPELDQIAWDLYRRVQQLVRVRGLDWELPGDESGVLAPVDPLLVDCAAAAIQGTSLFGDRAGQRVLQLGVVAGADDHSSTRRQRPPHGFDLHATRRVSRDDRGGLERLCNYIFKPPLAHDRLELLDDGRVRLRFTRPWSNGASHQILAPLDFIARLVALVPPPRVHQIRYTGFLASRSKIRRLVLPDRAETAGKVVQLSLFQPRPKPSASPSTGHDPSTHRTPTLQRIAWARLLKRIGYDMDSCPKCGAAMRVVSCVFAAEAIRKVLEARGEQSSPRTRPPARAPPQLSFGFATGSATPASTPAETA